MPDDWDLHLKQIKIRLDREQRQLDAAIRVMWIGRFLTWFGFLVMVCALAYVACETFSK